MTEAVCMLTLCFYHGFQTAAMFLYCHVFVIHPCYLDNMKTFLFRLHKGLCYHDCSGLKKCVLQTDLVDALSTFVFGFHGLPATGLHQCLQGEVWTNRHPALSKDKSKNYIVWVSPQENRSYESVRRHLFQQVP